MEELKEFLFVIGASIFGLVMSFIGLVMLVVLMATPFFAIGTGLSFIAWATCLHLPVC